VLAQPLKRNKAVATIGKSDVRKPLIKTSGNWGRTMSLSKHQERWKARNLGAGTINIQKKGAGGNRASLQIFDHSRTPQGNPQLLLESKHRGGMAAASRFPHKSRKVPEKEKGAM
jgi:hypothetical protein